MKFDPYEDIKTALEGREGWHTMTARVKRVGDVVYVADLSVLPPSSGPGSNSGHGHVWLRPDGIRARCAGPNVCPVCINDKKVYGL